MRSLVMFFGGALSVALVVGILALGGDRLTLKVGKKTVIGIMARVGFMAGDISCQCVPMLDCASRAPCRFRRGSETNPILNRAAVLNTTTLRSGDYADIADSLWRWYAGQRRAAKQQSPTNAQGRMHIVPRR